MYKETYDKISVAIIFAITVSLKKRKGIIFALENGLFDAECKITASVAHSLIINKLDPYSFIRYTNAINIVNAECINIHCTIYER